ncbi:MAG TPA: PIG-L deacetylase family protein, partial [Vicinamibacterales bacterium]|nr:PIG-L deacetylase family protein [Vicinamibacterales bacterium]
MSPTGLLTNRTILAVFAHPDDESLACGGTLARAAEEGARVVLLCLTRGEQGSVSNAALVPDGDLGAVRSRELREAAATLGLAQVVLLDHPDGQLPWLDARLLETEILVSVRHFRPDAVITFGADGLYWHPDHVAVHERTTAALAALNSRQPALYYVTMPEGTMRAVVEAAPSADPAGNSPWGIDIDAFGCRATAPTLVVDVTDYAARKLAALRCHRTQMGPSNPLARLTDEQARRLLGVEHFHLGGSG